MQLEIELTLYRNISDKSDENFHFCRSSTTLQQSRYTTIFNYKAIIRTASQFSYLFRTIFIHFCILITWKFKNELIFNQSIIDLKTYISSLYLKNLISLSLHFDAVNLRYFKL